MSARLPRPVRRARLGPCRRRGRGWTAREQISLKRPRGGRVTAMRRPGQWFARRAARPLGGLARGGGRGAAAPPAGGRWPFGGGRWRLSAGLAGPLGGLGGGGRAGLSGRAPPVPLPGPWALRGSLLGLAAGVVLAALQLGAGSLSAGLAHLSVPKLLSSGPGVVVAVELGSFAVAAVLLRLQRPRWAVLPLLAVVAAEGMRAHPESVVPGGGALLTWAHLLAAALWAGMLFYVVRAAIAWRADPRAVRGLVRLYARVAAWLFALVVVTGVVSAPGLVPLGSLVSTDYGRVLILKAPLGAPSGALPQPCPHWRPS